MTNIQGIITALVTPFKAGEIDIASMQRLVETQINAGIEGFVVNGTTGESPTLTEEEVETLFHLVKNKSGALPVILGTGTNCTRTTILNTQHAKKLGADAALVVVPYYNKPDASGLYAHFKKINDEVELPIILYNVPGRTVVSLDAETIIKLSQLTNIIGIKEASGQLDLINATKDKVDKGFVFLSGDDESCIEFIAAGGQGVISVVSHLIPQELKRVKDIILANPLENHKHEIESYVRYQELNKNLFSSPNPVPVKQALADLGIIGLNEVRLPLVTMGEEQKQKLRKTLKNYGMLS